MTDSAAAAAAAAACSVHVCVLNLGMLDNSDTIAHDVTNPCLKDAEIHVKQHSMVLLERRNSPKSLGCAIQPATPIVRAKRGSGLFTVATGIGSRGS